MKIIFFISFILLTNSHKMVNFTTTDILDPVKLRPYMFKT